MTRSTRLQRERGGSLRELFDPGVSQIATPAAANGSPQGRATSEKSSDILAIITIGKYRKAMWPTTMRIIELNRFADLVRRGLYDRCFCFMKPVASQQGGVGLCCDDR